MVRQVRVARGLTMAGLADLASVPTSTISRIESGKTEPTVAMLSRIARAAGFTYKPTLTEAGSDQPFADAVARLAEADVGERVRLLGRFPIVASTAPVARRTGTRRVAVPGGLVAAVELLQAQGQHPVVSGVEAVAASIDLIRSFVPLVYVDDPVRVERFAPGDRDAFQVMLLLPTTENVRRWTRNDTATAMVVREWGWLDAMASPGRQGDIAREEFASDPMVQA
ncbi:MAG: helix-turn-helix domain-containing protein [Micrococcales bacterium]|nr:helix-turn-helix domain-containing protein [Micrococcales bacterium]